MLVIKAVECRSRYGKWSDRVQLKNLSLTDGGQSIEPNHPNKFKQSSKGCLTAFVTRTSIV